MGYEADLLSGVIVLSCLVALGLLAWLGSVGWRAHVERQARRRRQEADSSPLATLELQLRLGQMAAEIRALSASGHFAAAHHTKAAEVAYDRLLDEACHRAGLHGYEPIANEEDRVIKELELSARGWAW